MTVTHLEEPVKLPFILNNERIFHDSDKSHQFTSFGSTDTDEDVALFKVQGCTVDEALQAAEASAAAFKVWRKVIPVERRKIFLRAIDIIKEKWEEGIALQVKETRCEAFFAERIFNDAISHLAEFAAQCTANPGTITAADSADTLPLIIREPIGPVLGIAAWNAAAILAMRSFATPIAAGCTVIFLTSEVSPATHLFVAQALIDAGLPSGVLQILHKRVEDAPAVTDALIRSPHIRKINFTGSTIVGRIIATTAAQCLKPCLLELGGKAAVIVLEDADLAAAAEAVVLGSWLNQGQICMSTERVFVERSVHDEFTSIVKMVAAKMHPVLVSNSQAVRRHASAIHALVHDAEVKGASFIYGQKEISGAKLHPCILSDVTPDMKIYSQETFGPCCLILPVENASEAVKITNESQYGLSSAVWSKDVLKAIRIARDIECGAVHINGITVHDEPTMPHGGVKESGYGNFGSTWGINEFTTLKTITISGYAAGY